jgi:hypothetical protein
MSDGLGEAIMRLGGREAALALVLTLLAAAAAAGAAASGGTAMTCTNVASGAQWQIHIDFQKSTVDANPAEITAQTISWHDASDGGNYTLDRKSGNLTVIVASSTGGYFLHHQCKPAN